MDVEVIKEIEVKPPTPEFALAPVEPPAPAEPAGAVAEAIDAAERAALDAHGAPHGVRADGTPAKKRGRKPGQRNAAPTEAAQPAQPPATVLPPVDYAMMAKQLTNIQINIAVNALGPEWAPNKEADEAKQIAAAWEGYLRAKNIAALSPELLLLVVQSCYVLPRLPQPETKSRLQRAIAWGRGLFAKKAKPE